MPDCIFANARASSREATLLGAERINRLAECAAPDDALKILAEVNFGSGVNVSSALDYEVLAEEEARRHAAFIKEVAPNERVARFLLAEYDYHNAETVARAKHLKTDYQSVTSAEGWYGLETLKDRIFAERYDLFSDPLAKALKETDKLFLSGQANGARVGTLFRRALYEELYGIALKEKPLLEIYRAKADAANISVALRTRSFVRAAEMLVPGGTLSEEDIRFLCEEPAERIRERFRHTARKALVFAAADDLEGGGALVSFEKAADGYALALLKKDMYSTEGYMPFLRYCYYKSAELHNVRIVLSCLNNGLEPNKIKARIRETYEGQNGRYR